MSVPWSTHEEYLALHEKVPGYVTWDGSVTVNRNSCPYGQSQCAFGSSADSASRIDKGRTNPVDCPRFGGISRTELGGCRGQVCCRGPRWFEAMKLHEPTTAGAQWVEVEWVKEEVTPCNE